MKVCETGSGGHEMHFLKTAFNFENTIMSIYFWLSDRRRHLKFFKNFILALKRSSLLITLQQ